MNINKIKTMVIIFLLFFTNSCEDNGPISTLTPESATISGTITFTGTWPVSGDIAVSLSSTWPPTGAPAASVSITYLDLTNNTYTYTFENVSFGEYGAISVSWLDPDDNNPASNQHIIGSYGGTANYIYGPYFDATSITVSETQYTLTGKDFGADLSMVGQ